MLEKCTYNTEPFSHWVIEDFLSPRMAKECLAEAIRLEPFYESAEIFNDTHVDDDCVECKAARSSFFNRNQVRNNEVIYLDNLFKDKRPQSNVLGALERQFTSMEFKDMMDHSEGTFPLINCMTTTESVLSRYGKCDFYGWHTDSIPEDPKQRMFTGVYYINVEPFKFKGGRLMLRHANHKDVTYIEPKHNSMIIFPSSLVHAVEYVNLDFTDWKFGRFSVNVWLGNSDKDYRFR